jgi:phosphate transport system substrate-binding protein
MEKIPAWTAPGRAYAAAQLNCGQEVSVVSLESGYMKIQIEGKGSSTAPPALIAGTAQLGPMSREMKGTETDQFEKKFGYKPIAIELPWTPWRLRQQDNPVKCLSFEHGCCTSNGAPDTRRISHLGTIGSDGDWGRASHQSFGRNLGLGDLRFFQRHTLKNGDFWTR